MSGLVDDDGIARVLAEHRDPHAAAAGLVDAALAAGGDDNATAVVVDVVGWGSDQDEHQGQDQGPSGDGGS